MVYSPYWSVQPQVIWMFNIMITILFCRSSSCVLTLCALCSGSMEFVVPAADPSSFFPISVGFSASGTFSDLKVGSVLPHSARMDDPPMFGVSLFILVNCVLSETFQVIGIHPLKDGNPPKFSQRARLLTANYQVVWWCWHGRVLFHLKYFVGTYSNTMYFFAMNFFEPWQGASFAFGDFFCPVYSFSLLPRLVSTCIATSEISAWVLAFRWMADL